MKVSGWTRHCLSATMDSILIIAVIVLVTACRQAPVQSNSTSIRIALTKSPISYLPVYLAQEPGNYRAEALDVTIEDFPGATKPMQALKWSPSSRPFLGLNKLMSDGVVCLSFGRPHGQPPVAIPALDPALGAHPCVALSSGPACIV